MKLLCYGDSNTYGFDPRDFFGGRYEADSRWPELLAAENRWEVCNFGQNGRTVPDSAWEVETLCHRIRGLQPDWLLILLGTNDLLRGLEPEQIAARMERLLEALPPIPVLLLSPPELAVPGLGERLPGLAAAYEQLARRRGANFCDLRRWNLPLAYDGVHLTEEGHRLLAEHLREFLRETEKSILKNTESYGKMQSVSYN